MDASEYAKHRGVSKPMVTKYLREGKIQSARKIGRTWQIDPEQADRELDASLDRSHGGKNGVPPEPPIQTSQSNPRSIPSLAENRSIREFYAARIAKLDYEQRAGKLIPKDELRLKLAKMHLAVRDNLRTIPDRVAPVLAAETDQAKIHAILIKEIGLALEGLKSFDWR